MANDPLTRLFQQCKPDEPLPPTDPRYEDCDDARGARVARQIVADLRRSNPFNPDYKLFTGHRGVGKTTELLRVKHELEHPPEGDRPFHVIYSDITELLDTNDIEVTDLLVLLAGWVQSDMRKTGLPGFGVVTTKLQSWWDDLKAVLGSAVQLTEIEADAGLAKLTLEIKNQESARARMRREIEMRSTRLIEAINDLLEAAVVALRQAGKAGLVLIVDGLDKIALRQLEGGSNTHRRFFVDGADKLASLKAHVVYTVPINLVYTPEFSQNVQTFGEACVPVPMIRLQDHPGTAVALPEIPGWQTSVETARGRSGLDALEAVLRKRAAAAEVAFETIFDAPETLQLLCRMTGGHPRHLLMFVRTAIGKVDRLPLTRAAVQAGIKEYAQSLAREIPGEYWPWLQAFQEPRIDFPAGIPDGVRQGMLLWLYVFEYANGQQFYGLNPLIRLLPRLYEPLPAH